MGDAENKKFIYITPEKARRHFSVSDTTLRKWDREGKIDTIRVGKHRRYKIQIEDTYTKENICYARVSSYDQKEDLERQINVLKSRYPTYRIIKDIGSGINFKRKGFNSILEQIIRGNINEVVVTNKDRLCRFGFELIESIIKTKNGKLVVLYNEDKSPDQELVEDVLTIITVFSSKMYGRRSSRNKRNKG